MFAIALAYAGTGSNQMVKKLLHVAVSDVNDDVRRAAVTALGFVLFRNHTQVPRIVQLLAESYNPHVRHGATLALGISCAGTGLEAAVELLEPMTRDPVDFVRQGAFSLRRAGRGLGRGGGPQRALGPVRDPLRRAPPRGSPRRSGGGGFPREQVGGDPPPAGPVPHRGDG
ncbi:MAG: hypothetical protein EOO77_31030 [Oxalobacteraceae bacterium]|nr:MAG: hypothetical protein EOO77_31030 [Oxalobacteraceae bacterium]